MISSARPSSVSPAQFVDGPLDEVPVEPGGRFVGEQQRGVADQGEGGRGALGEAAGELVRVAVEVALGERGAGGRDQGGLAQSAPPHPGQLAQALLQLGPDGAHGREVGGGALRYETDAPSPYRAGEGALVGGQQVRVPAEHRAAGGRRVGGQQSEQGRGQDGLAAAALTDQGQALPRRDGEPGVGDGRDVPAAAHPEADGEVLHVEDGHTGVLTVVGHSISSDFRRGLIRSRQAPASPASARVGMIRKRPGKRVGHQSPASSEPRADWTRLPRLA